MTATVPTGAPPTAAGPVEPRSGPEAALYQRLREHLAYLRLPDAAAALPGVLDDARTRSLSPTATLERLLAVEVEATEARRLAGRQDDYDGNDQDGDGGRYNQRDSDERRKQRKY